MKTNTFSLWHSVVGTAVLLLIEIAAFHTPSLRNAREILLLSGAIIGTIVTIYVATEVVEEVRGRSHMFTILTVVMLQFIVFFAIEYWFLCTLQPTSFPTMPIDAVTLTLHSVMIFVFNPLYLPGTVAGRALVLINTFGALALVLFVLQNIGELRRKSLDVPEGKSVSQI
ncbi:MAG: hypothetical protein ABIT47_04320 [Candidatus Paceibacterota bacterium]